MRPLPSSPQLTPTIADSLYLVAVKNTLVELAIQRSFMDSHSLCYIRLGHPSRSYQTLNFICGYHSFTSLVAFYATMLSLLKTLVKRF